MAGEPAFNLSYRFAPVSWGRGYATETALAGIEAAQRCAPSRPVLAIIHADNRPSAAVAQRVGLVRAEEIDYHGGRRWLYRQPRTAE